MNGKLSFVHPPGKAQSSVKSFGILQTFDDSDEETRGRSQRVEFESGIRVRARGIDLWSGARIG